MSWIRTAKYGSKKISDTALHTIRGNVIEILEDATFTTINEMGITSPITVHNVAGVQPAGEFVYAKTKFTGLQLSAGVVRIGGYRRKRILGLSAAIKAAAVLWLFAKPTRDTYILGKNGTQDRELASGEIFPGRGYEGDGTNYITLDSDIVFADNAAWAVSCFVEWDVIAQADGIFGNLYTAGDYTRWTKIVAGTGYDFFNEVNDTVAWTFTIPTVRHHILIQCDGTDANNLELFLDGVSEGTKTLADTAIVIHEMMSIGDGQRPLDGIIEDFRVYGRLLDSTEIAALQTKDPLGGELLWYPCEDVDLFTALDASGNENHGTKVSWDSANHIEGSWYNLMNRHGYNEAVKSAEKIINGTFDTDTDWTKQAGWTIADGKAIAIASTTYLFQDAGLNVGKTYEVIYTVSDYVGGTCRAIVCGSGNGTIRNANGTYTEYIVGSGGNNNAYIQAVSSFTGKIDNFSVKEYFADEVPADLSEATAIQYTNIMDAGKGTFDVGVESWVKWGNNLVVNDDGALKITYVDDDKGAYVYLRGAQDLNTDLTLGKPYKLRAYCKRNSAGPVNLYLYEVAGGSSVVIDTEWSWVEIEFNATSPTGHRMQLQSFGVGEIVWIDEWYVEEISYAPSAAQNDVLGNALVYKGQADYHGISVDAACFEGDSLCGFDLEAPQDLGKTCSIYFECNLPSSNSMICSDGTSDDYMMFRTTDILRYVVNGGTLVDLDISPTIFDTENHKCLFTRAGTELKFYVDGILQDTKTLGNDDAFDLQDLLKNASSYFTGKLWNMKFFSTVVTAADAAVDIPDIAWYPLSEGAGTTAYDVVGQNHGAGLNIDETNWGTQDDFHYIRDHGMQPMVEFFGTDLNSYVELQINQVTALSTEKVTVQVDYSLDVANRYILGGGAYIQLQAAIINWRMNSAVSIAVFNTTGNVPQYGRLTLEHDGAGNYTATIVNPEETWTDSATTTAYVFNNLDTIGARSAGSTSPCDGKVGAIKIWVEDVLQLDVPDPYTGYDLISETYGTVYGLTEKRFIPALADESGDAILGNAVTYPHSGVKAIPDTYFKLPENIGELIAADLEPRYLDIMDTGKGVFTPFAAELITNGGFDADTDWDKGPGWTIVGGKAVATATTDELTQTGVFTIDKLYSVTYTVSDYVSGTFRIQVGNAVGATISANGIYTDTLICVSNTNFDINALTSFTGKIDNISAKEQNIESWTPYGTNILSNDNGALKIEVVDNGSGGLQYLRETYDTNTDLTVGTEYVVAVRAKSDEATATMVVFDGTSTEAQTVTADWAWYEFTFTATHATNCNMRQGSLSAGDNFWIDEWYIVEAQTSLGNNSITDGEGFRWDDDNSDGVGNGWTNMGGTGTHTIVTGNGFVGNAQNIDHVTGTNTRFQYDTGIAPVSGQTYQVTGKFRADIDGVRLYLRSGSDPLSLNMGTNTGDAIAFSYTVDASGSAGTIVLDFYILAGVASGYVEIDEVELTPVIPSVFYEPAALGLAPVVINTSDIPAVRYLTQYYDITNRKNLIMLEANHGLGDAEHKRLLKFTKNT